ncbi:MAG: hypothetical protein BGO10_00130 [Chlamydia sp. 32-24]|nr:MAG: hypothetical protein BGO10_00130 [Chlamydia sp. 32-24]
MKLIRNIVFILCTVLIATSYAENYPQEAHLSQKQAEGGELKTFPEVSRYVNEVGQRLAKVSHTSHLPYEFVVINCSEPNAWAFPDGKIGITRGFFNMLHNEAELAAILAHEIGHQVGYEREKQLEKKTAYRLSNPKGFKFVDYVNDVIETKKMREAEFEADRCAIEYLSKAGYDVKAANEVQSRFKKFEQNSSHMPDLTNTHPKVDERLAANLQTMKRFPSRKNATYGKQNYDKIIGPLKKVNPVYDTYEQGEIALQNGDYQNAKQIALQAVKQIPNESRFYGLLGKAHIELGNPQEGLKALDKALSLDHEYFEHHLMKGIAMKNLGYYDQAQLALEKSQNLYPTPVGDFHLGEIALKKAHYEAAKRFFRMASTSDSTIGEKAKKALIYVEKNFS